MNLFVFERTGQHRVVFILLLSWQPPLHFNHGVVRNGAGCLELVHTLGSHFRVPDLHHSAHVSRSEVAVVQLFQRHKHSDQIGVGQRNSVFFASAVGAASYKVARVTPCYEHISSRSRIHNTGDCFSLNGHFYLHLGSIPEFERAVVRNRHKFLLRNLYHLVDA